MPMATHYSYSQPLLASLIWHQSIYVGEADQLTDIKCCSMTRAVCLRPSALSLFALSLEDNLVLLGSSQESQNNI